MKKIYLKYLFLIASFASFLTASYAQCPQSIVFPSLQANAVNHINSNNYRLGSSKFTLSYSFNGTPFTFGNEISTDHQSARSIYTDHDERIITDANHLNQQLSFSIPIYNLNFSINDLDNGDRVRVFAYDQNSNLIPFTSSNYSYTASTITNTTTNLFVSADRSTSNANVSINFNNQYVSRVVLEYFDLGESGGSYTVANITGASVCAQNDAFGTLTPGTTTAASVFANDMSSTGGIPTPANTSVSLTNLGGLIGATINVNGTLNIPATATPGPYTLTYNICSPTGQTNYCATANITLAIPNQVDAVNDAFGTVVAGAVTPSVFANDKSSTGAIPTATTANATLTNLGGLTGATINANGTINIPANATPGSYTLTYRICSPTGQTSSCDNATVSVCVASAAIPNFNDFENSNYRYFYDSQGQIASFSIKCGGGNTANLTLLTPRTALPASPLPTGHTITWHSASPATDANQITDPLTAVTGATRKVYASFRSVAGCYSPTREISIYAPICANNDDYTATPITYGVGGTLPSIYINDTYRDSIISSLPPSTVDFNGEIWVDANAQVNASNGVITIPPTTPPGTYTYIYSIIDKDPDGVTGSNRSVATVTFRVVSCTNPPNLATPENNTKTGVSNLEGFANGWPTTVPNGFIAIESKKSGFVITRVKNASDVANPIEGMLVYDITAACIKLYRPGTGWKCLAKDCN